MLYKGVVRERSSAFSRRWQRSLDGPATSDFQVTRIPRGTSARSQDILLTGASSPLAQMVLFLPGLQEHEPQAAAVWKLAS